MLMAVDIGNTSISVGVFGTEGLIHHFRIRVTEQKTLCEALSKELTPDILNQTKIIAVASVNPGVEKTFCTWLKDNYGRTSLKVGTDIPIKIPILVHNPERVGVDRLLNAIAAFQRMRTGAIVVDFGTAITFDVVSDNGEYLGGAIAPGIETSAYALNTRTAFLPRVSINKPSHALGKNTEEAISSGIYWGTVGMVERILRELFNELGYQPKVIATGGDAELIGPDIPLISDIIPDLTLEGIRIVHAAYLFEKR
ncbi:MAG TPA: type III pantothenate kinase [Candidatus Brocadiales bacterium]|nr:type III pantothenate kinase [Candidatus Brocadiales bacterium]